MLSALNACLTAGVFPSVWRAVRLVFISKGKGDPQDAVSVLSSEYVGHSRTLSILQGTGKYFPYTKLPFVDIEGLFRGPHPALRDSGRAGKNEVQRHILGMKYWNV